MFVAFGPCRTRAAILLARPGRRLRFSLAGASSGQLVARRLDPDEHAASGVSKAGEAWELTLRLPRSGPFEIRAVRSSPFTDLCRCRWPRSPEASSPARRADYSPFGETGIGIDNHHRLRMIPAELAEAELYRPLAGPTGTSRLATLPVPIPRSAFIHVIAGSRGRRSGVAQPIGIARVSLHDATVHVATWYVQTAGRSRLEYSLPPAKDAGVMIDDSPLPDALVSGFGSKFSLDLPAGKQFATVLLSFVAEGRLPLAGSLLPAWPEVDVPVLARRWKDLAAARLRIGRLRRPLGDSTDRNPDMEPAILWAAWSCCRANGLSSASPGPVVGTVLVARGIRGTQRRQIQADVG